MRPQLGDLKQIARILVEENVEFIVVGGQAEWLMGGHRATLDVDICYRKTQANLERMARALLRMDPVLRNAPPDLPFIIDARSLALGDNFTFSTAHGDFDLLGYLEPLGDYERLIKNVERCQFGEYVLNLIGLDDLIIIKQHIGREKDKASLRELLAIKRVREEGVS